MDCTGEAQFHIVGRGQDEHRNFQNPLLNSLVIGNLFKYLSNNELMRCRRVCSLWNNEASIILKIRMLIDFSGANVKQIFSFLSLIKPYTSHELQIYLHPELLQLQQPFGKYSIQIWDSESYRSRFISLPGYTEAFFNHCGPLIQSLQISFHDFIETMTDRKFRNWFLHSLANNLKILELNGLSSYVPHYPSGESQSVFDDNNIDGNDDSSSASAIEIMPNLHSLIMTDFFDEEPEEFGTGKRRRFNSAFIKDIIKMTPFLQSITINTFGNVNSSLTQCVLMDGLPFLKNANHNFLQKLELQTVISDQQLKSINACSFQLTSVELKYLDFNSLLKMTDTLGNFLVAQAETLRHLKLGIAKSNTHYDEELPFKIRFPAVMKCLISLSLESSSITKRPIQLDICETFCGQNELPALQKLALLGNSILEDLRQCSHQATTHKVLINELELPSRFDNEELLMKISTSWTAVRCLKFVSPSTTILKLLWRLKGFWNSIENLEIVLANNSEEIEAALSGLPSALSNTMDTDIYETLEQGRAESILNLSKLSKFVLILDSENCDPAVKVNITDSGIYSTISKMKSLTSLTIRNSNISDAGLKFIQENMPSLIHLDIT